ncbi:MAG: hypothetical protein HOV83_19525 [Catenulispora sp.]|nr:hypothetical protein [Catenulispora sp.]
MSTTTVVQYATKPEAADENARLIRAVFDELAEKRPAGLRYAAYRLADGVSFVHVVQVDGDDNPLPGLAAFAEFQKGIGERVVAAPVFTSGTALGAYA